MNIENEKISGRQLGRMVFYDFFGLTTLVLPGYLAKRAGMDGFFCLVIGFGAGYLFLLFVLSQMRRMEQGYQVYLAKRFGNILTGLLLFCYLLTALFGAAYGLQMLGNVICRYLIRDTSMWLILGVLTILAVYGLSAGLECRGRLYEVVFWFVALPLIILFFLAMFSVEPEGWLPVFRAGGAQLAEGSYVVFAFLMSAAFLPMLAGDVAGGAEGTRVLKQSFALGMCLNLALFLLLAGIFRIPTMAVIEEPALTLTAMVKVPGGFFERQDALLCGIWFVSIFAFVENALYYSVYCVRKICRKREQGWFLFGAGLLVYVTSLAMHYSRALLDTLVRYYLVAAVPLLVIVALLAGILPAHARGAWWRGKEKSIAGTAKREEGAV